MIKKIVIIILIIMMYAQLFAGSCCNNNPCKPYPRYLKEYASYTDHTKMCFISLPKCPPRNDSLAKGYLYKGSFWDTAGVRYWAFRNTTDSTITIDAIDGGEQKDIPAGDVANVSRGQSYNFRVQASAKLFELFNSDAHNIEIFINAQGNIDYRAEQPLKKARLKKENTEHPRL